MDVLDQYTPTKAIAIFDVNEDETYMTLIVSHGLGPNTLKMSAGGPLDEALAGLAVKKRRVVSSNDITEDDRMHPEVRAALTKDGLTALLIVPIIYQERVLGVMTLGFEKDTFLEPEKRETVLAVANTICLAMANARYVDQIQREIAERKAAQEEARRLNEELEQRVKERTLSLEVTNRELEAFTYSVSHDLRAPLRAIDGFSQALLEDYLDDLKPDAQNYLDRLRKASQRMGQLIDDLLMLSRVTRSDMRRQRVNLTETARAIVTDLREISPERQVEVVIHENLYANADPRLMTIMLSNLLGNAWKFTNKKQQARVEFGYTKEGDKPVFFVRDDGAGFDMTYAEKLFSAFQRLHNMTEFEGTGIGLATVQRIIHRHGGRIWAEGEIDHGATFYFEFG